MANPVTPTVAATAGKIYKPDVPGSSLTFDELFGTFMGILLMIIVIAGFVYLIYSAMILISSGGDAAKAQKGKSGILWAVIGLVVASLSYSILKLVVGLF